MRASAFHTTVSLMLVALLLVQYAPVVKLAGEAHAVPEGAFCLRGAHGKRCPHHQEGHAHEAPQQTSHHTASPHHDAGDHHANAPAASPPEPHERTKQARLCSCGAGQAHAPFVLVLHKVTAAERPVWPSAAPGLLHFAPALMLAPEPFATDIFHPPPVRA